MSFPISFWAFNFVYTVASYLMFKRQNKKSRLGGTISGAKAFWLSYAIYVWFLLIPLLLIFKKPDSFFHDALLFLTASMWIRGLIELFMLFVIKNWTPPIGITHDLLTLIGTILWPIFCHDRAPVFSSATLPWYIFLFGLLLSLTVETYYAFAFFKLVREKTQGEEGIWYANAEEEKFKRVISVTRFFNWVLGIILVYFLVYV